MNVNVVFKHTELNKAVKQVFVEARGPLTTTELYKRVKQRLVEQGYEELSFNIKAPIGKEQVEHNLFHRKVRYIQASLKQQKLLRRVRRNVWEYTGNGEGELHAIKQGKCVLAMSTQLGLCIWSRSETVFNDVIDEPISLVLTSPPYPLRIARAYGNPASQEYTDFICRILEPLISRLAEGGSIALNVGNDIFQEGSPARTTYIERLIIALEDRFGLHLMDRLIWSSNKEQKPQEWVVKRPIQLATAYEPVIWMCNNPLSAFSNNNRALLPHSKEHKRFIAQGGQRNDSGNKEQNNMKRAGTSYKNVTPGKKPLNVIRLNDDLSESNLFTVGNNCTTGRYTILSALNLGIASHGAKMPYTLADFLIRFLTEPGQLVVDPMAGTLTTASAAENNGRRWVCTEMVWEYIRQSFVRFIGNDIWVNPHFAEAF